MIINPEHVSSPIVPFYGDYKKPSRLKTQNQGWKGKF